MSLQDELDEMVVFAEQQLNSFKQKTQLEKQLAKQMPLKFEENIQAFIKYLPDIAKQFRHYRPKDLQLFCAKSGAANLFDEKTGNPLYNEDPVQQCREQVERLIAKPQFTSLSFPRDVDERDNFIHTKYLSQLYNIYLDAAKNAAPMTRVPEHLGSAIIFGIGLGYHLKLLLDDITIDHLYICEPDNDWFFASLYTCDWKQVLELVDQRDGVIVLNIGVSYEQFTTDFINELKHKGSFNSVNALLYQHYPSAPLREIIDKFSADFHLVAMGWGFFDDGVISIAHEVANGRKQLPLLKKDAQLPKNWRNMPAFIIANGPSFDAAIETIKAYQGQAIIFCCGSALQPMLSQGIIPDFYIAMERTRSTYDFIIEFTDAEQLKQINFLSPSIIHPDCPALFKWTGMALKSSEPSTTISSEYIDLNQTLAQLKYCNPQVANTGLAFVCHMGFEEVYLFGVDAGYKDKQFHHSKHSPYYTNDGKEKEAIGDHVRTGEVVVEGNFGGTVFSPVLYNTARIYLQHCLASFAKVNCYNCADGAKIKHTTPVYLDDLMLMSGLPDKNEVIDFIKSELYLPRNFNEAEYIEWLAFDKFNQICDTMVGYVDKDFTSRAELADALKQQVRHLFSYVRTRYRHVYFLLEGSLTYVHAIFRMMLYGFEDEQVSLECMKKGIAVFIAYMNEAKEKYRGAVDEVDDQQSFLLDNFREEGEA